jgi:nucleoside-diphosphate-sugar epimerase
MKNERCRIVEEDCERAVAGRADHLAGLRGETVLITGGTGFFGIWMAELIGHLNDRHGFGTRLVLLSRQESYPGARAPLLFRRKDLTLIPRDVRTVSDLPAEVTLLIHAAASPDTRRHASDPLGTIHVIVNGTDAVLSAATRLPDLKRVLTVSSALIYGSQPWDVEGMAEDFAGGRLDCGSALSSYAEAKRLAETLAASYRNEHRLPIVNVRPFAFMGPYQLLERPWAINNFIRDSLQGGPIRILGDGETVRSYMYASDMAFWVLRMLTAGAVGQSYNLGSPAGIRLGDLAQKIALCFPSAIPVECRGLVSAAARRSKMVPDVRLAQETLGLSLRVDLDTALRRTILWNQAEAHGE